MRDLAFIVRLTRMKGGGGRKRLIMRSVMEMEMEAREKTGRMGRVRLGS